MLRWMLGKKMFFFKVLLYISLISMTLHYVTEKYKYSAVKSSDEFQFCGFRPSDSHLCCAFFPFPLFHVFPPAVWFRAALTVSFCRLHVAKTTMLLECNALHVLVRAFSGETVEAVVWISPTNWKAVIVLENLWKHLCESLKATFPAYAQAGLHYDTRAAHIHVHITCQGTPA